MHPVAIVQIPFFAARTGKIEPVAPEDLPEPGILRAPGMIHRDRPLCDRMKGKLAMVAQALFERLMPAGQRIEITRDAFAMRLGRLDGAMALCRQAEFLQGLEIELKDHGLRPADEAEGRRPFEIVAI